MGRDGKGWNEGRGGGMEWGGVAGRRKGVLAWNARWKRCDGMERKGMGSGGAAAERAFFRHRTPLRRARGRRLGARGVVNLSVLACCRELCFLSSPAALLPRQWARTAAWPRERRRGVSPSEDEFGFAFAYRAWSGCCGFDSRYNTHAARICMLSCSCGGCKRAVVAAVSRRTWLR